MGKAQAISKAKFHEKLRDWFENTDNKILDPEVLATRPWEYVKDGMDVFVLHSDTKREAVEWYLGIVEIYGDDLLWSIVPSQSGKKTAVAYGPERLESTTPRFFLYKT